MDAFLGPRLILVSSNVRAAEDLTKTGQRDPGRVSGGETRVQEPLRRNGKATGEISQVPVDILDI
jgi:hypothetical protein